MPERFIKDPAAVLDYYFDWKSLTNGTGDTDWLASGETISEYELSVSPSVAIDSHAAINGNTAVRFWMPAITNGQKYRVRCSIVTSEGRKDTRSIWINGEDR